MNIKSICTALLLIAIVAAAHMRFTSLKTTIQPEGFRITSAFWSADSDAKRKIIYSVPANNIGIIECAGVDGILEWYRHEYTIQCGPQVSGLIGSDTISTKDGRVRIKVPAGADMLHVEGKLDTRKFEVHFETNHGL